MFSSFEVSKISPAHIPISFLISKWNIIKNRFIISCVLRGTFTLLMIFADYL